MNRSGKVTVRVKKAARVQQLVEKSGVSSHARSDVKKMNDLKVAAGCVKGAVPLEIDQSQLQQALARGGVGDVSKLLSERRVVNMVLGSPDYLLNSVVFWCPILGCSKPRHTLNGSHSTKVLLQSRSRAPQGCASGERLSLCRGSKDHQALGGDAREGPPPHSGGAELA